MLSIESAIMQGAEPSASIEGASTVSGSSLEELFSHFAEYLILGIDFATGIVIGVSAAWAIIGFFRIVASSKHPERLTINKEAIRLRLARGMLLAIDLQVGSIILKTIIVPSFEELAMLAAIVGIKIVIGWTLSKETNRHQDLKSRLGDDEEGRKWRQHDPHKSDSAP
jgi:uncharacterized membrane protein